MTCPVCQNVSLSLSERQGIEIDYCPQCRGVWLDRGELDKLIDRSQEEQAAGRRWGGDDDEAPLGRRGRGGRRESLLSDLFDFG